MSEKVAENTVQITESDVRNKYIPLRHIFDDLFPEDCLGGDDWAVEPGDEVTIHLDKVGEFKTDIYRTKKTPRRTGLVQEFYERGNAKKGSHLFIEKLGSHEFRITVLN